MHASNQEILNNAARVLRELVRDVNAGISTEGLIKRVKGLSAVANDIATAVAHETDVIGGEPAVPSTAAEVALEIKGVGEQIETLIAEANTAEVTVEPELPEELPAVAPKSAKKAKE